MPDAPFVNCEACRTTTGRAGCPTHGGGVWAAGIVWHRHVWQYRGQTADASLVMVCDDHDPPIVRTVRAALAQPEDEL